MDDPNKLKKQKPDYVKDVSGSADPDHQPQIGTDPMSQPEEGTKKTIVSPDPEKVAEAERKRAVADRKKHKD
jgi:hypothetical protein